jgi:hypothetical protein
MLLPKLHRHHMQSGQNLWMASSDVLSAIKSFKRRAKWSS